MKKTLIALAVLAASSASMAQVTLYGVADVSLGAINATGVKSDANMKTNDVTNDGNSRWGIKVVEDLGGGMKATAQFEQNIDYSTGATGTADARYAYLALDGGFGRIKAGRTLSPSFFGVAAWELTGAANFSAVANQFGFAGGGSRNSREFSYTTPNMGGFSATLGYVTELDGIENGGLGSKLDANAVYAAGPLAVGLSYWKNDKVAAGASTDGNYALGASYNFGGFTVAGSFQDAAGTSQGWTLGAGIPVGPWKFVVDVAQDTGFEDTDYLLYAGYSLSKRTTAYFDYRRDGKSGKVGGKSAVDADIYGIGVRHNF
ncbi:MAG: porin [Rhodoferax sp.]|jgi:predicted porin